MADPEIIEKEAVEKDEKSNETKTNKSEKKKSNKESGKENGVKGRIEETFNNFHPEEKLDDLYSYARSNTVETVSYFILFLGVLFSFFKPSWGGTLIGVVFGVYFAEDIIFHVKNIQDFITKQGAFKSIVLLVSLLGLFLGLPMFFVGAAAAVLIKYLVSSTST